MSGYKNYIDGLLNESTIRAKIDDILKNISSDQRFHLPDSRREIIKEIVGEFEGMKKKSIVKLQKIMNDKIEAGDSRLTAIASEVSKMNPEVLEELGEQREKLNKLLEDGRTNDNSVKMFLQGLIADLAGFSDEEVRTAIKLENEIANALKA